VTGPTTRIEGKDLFLSPETCDSKGREKARKAQSREGKNRISVITGIQLF